MLVHASIDERGKINGGNAGDQTGKEVCTRAFYSKPWNVMLRYKDASIAKKASEIAIKLANSNLVGYDQYQRNTLYKELKKNGFNVDKYIKSGVKTETDCSAFQHAVYACLVSSMRYNGNPPTTSTMRDFFKKNGFTVYTDSKYLTTDNYLIPGDVLVSEGHHTVQNTTTGSKVTTTKSTSTPSTKSTTSTSTSSTKSTSSSKTSYYAKYTGKSSSVVDALKSLKIDSSLANRKKIAKVNGMPNYSGKVTENTKLLSLLKSGKLVKA